jgi:hypothetical protein
VAEHTTAKLAPEVYVTPVSYRVTIMPEKCLRRSDLRHWNLEVVPVSTRFAFADEGWIVRDGFSVLGRDRTWNQGPQSEAEFAPWLGNCAYATAQDAIGAAREYAPEVTVNGLTAVEVLARHRERERGEECCRG